VSWLLAHRVEADTRARHKAEKKIPDTRERVIRELERVAFNDVRDLVQWDKRAVLDDDGQVVGFEDFMVVRPSRLMTPDQAASVRSITTKAGQLKFETHDKLGALEKLAKVLGIHQEPALPPVSQSMTVNQVHFSGDNALEAARRLASLSPSCLTRARPGKSSRAMRRAGTRKTRPPASEAGGAQLSPQRRQMCSRMVRGP